MNPYDELSQMREELDHVSMSRDAANERFLAARERHDEAQIDPSSYHRKANGKMEMSSTYQADTLINISGVETTVESAIAAGLVSPEIMQSPLGSYETLQSDHEENAEYDEEYEELDEADEVDIANLHQSYSPETKADIQYMENILGNETLDQLAFIAVSKGLDGSEEEIARLASASGMTKGAVLDTALAAVADQANLVVNSFEQITGYQVDSEHLMAYLTSTALSQSERMTISHAMRSGNGAMLSQLANKYAQYNNWR